jgi:DNA repair exonuclease SbcCD ATPase subunit
MPAKTSLKGTSAKKNSTEIPTISTEKQNVLLNAHFDLDDYLSEEETEEKPKKVIKKKVTKKDESIKDPINDIILLQNNNKIIKYVVHLADIHIKKRDREDEFRIVFDNLLENLKSKKLNCNDTVIVVAGDVIDNGIDLHPRSVKLTKDFIIMLASVADVILISGNHDLSPQNDKDNGLYSAIFETKTINNVHFLESQGLYEYNNILFGHTKFGDGQFVQQCDFETDKIKCGLYHGTLSGSKIESGIVFENTRTEKKFLTVGDFKDYQYVFLGDIHKHSFLTDKIAYPGSLLQLDQSESLIKGYILWNLDKEKGEFVRIKSDYGRIKVNIDEKGKADVDIKNLPKYVDVDVECQSMNRKHIDDFYSKITLGNITIGKRNDRMKYDQNTFDTKIEIDGKKQDLILIKNKEDVVSLLINKLDKNINKSIVNDLKNIVSDSLKEYNFEEHLAKKNIKLISIKFDNMAIFGENNFIDFTKLKGIVGLPGLNSSGKSSFVDAILQSIFGSCTRGSRYDMINSNKNSYKSEIVLEVNGVKYKINRVANRNKSKKKSIKDPDAKEKILFYEGNKNISDKNTKQTQALITQKIGTVFDFIISCFVTQKSMSQGECIGFAELNGKDRKNMLCKIARLDVYDYLSKIYSTALLSATQDIGKLKNLLNNYEDFGDKKEDINNNLENKIKVVKEQLLKNTEQDNQNKLYKENFLKKISGLEVEIKNYNEKIDNIVKNNNDIKKYKKINDNSDVIKKIENDMKDNQKQINNKCKEREQYEYDLKKIGSMKKIENEFKLSKKKIADEIKEQLKDKRKEIVNSFTFDYSKYKKSIVDKEIQLIDNSIKEVNVNEQQIKKKIFEFNKVINLKLTKILKSKVDNYNKKVNDMKQIKNKLIDCKNKLGEYEDKYDILKNHEYDENCKYCMKNTITQEKLYLEKIISEIHKNIAVFEKNEKSLNVYVSKNQSVVDEYENYIQDLENKENAEKQIISLKKDLQLLSNKNDLLQRKRQDLVLVNDNYFKYLNNDKLEKEIEKLEEQIDFENNRVCDQVLKYEMLVKKISNVEFDIKKIEVKHEKDKCEYEKQKNIKEKNNIYCEIVKELKILESKRLKVIKICGEQKEELNDIIIKLQKFDNKIKDETNILVDLQHKKVTFVELYENIKNAEKKKDNYTLLVQLLKSDGGIIDTIMLKNLLPKFNNIVNELLVQFGEEEVDITYENLGIKIRDKYGVDVVKNGGYKTYLNNLVYRIAISRLNSYMSTDFMIIDEVCDSADNEKKQNVKKLIDYLRVINKWTIIISHDEDVKDTYGMLLRIKQNAQNNRSHKIELM